MPGEQVQTHQAKIYRSHFVLSEWPAGYGTGFLKSHYIKQAAFTANPHQLVLWSLLLDDDVMYAVRRQALLLLYWDDDTMSHHMQDAGLFIHSHRTFL
jgi:hypothetical protein